MEGMAAGWVDDEPFRGGPVFWRICRGKAGGNAPGVGKAEGNSTPVGSRGPVHVSSASDAAAGGGAVATAIIVLGVDGRRLLEHSEVLRAILVVGGGPILAPFTPDAPAPAEDPGLVRCTEVRVLDDVAFQDHKARTGVGSQDSRLLPGGGSSGASGG